MEDAPRQPLVKMLENFFIKLKEGGYTIYAVGSVGSIPAIAAALSLLHVIGPLRKYLTAARLGSGATIPWSLWASGISSEIVRKMLTRLHLKDVVEDIGFFAEHNETKSWLDYIRNLLAYYLSLIYSARTILKHLIDHRVGIVRGDNIRKLLEEGLMTNDFTKTSPPLEIVATGIAGSKIQVFSGETTPEVKISDAVVASCAIRHVFAIQTINGKNFVDAAQKEAVPLLSVIDSHIARGGDPNKLFIIGTFVHTLQREEPTEYHYMETDRYFSNGEHTDKFRAHLELATYRGAKCMIIEFDATNVVLPSASPFRDLIEEFGVGFRRLRKIIASLFNSGLLEKVLRGVAIHLYREINMQHLPYYLDKFDATIEDKIRRRIENFKF